jgi:hypothetical protein
MRGLPGIESDAALGTFVFQIIESVRRIRFISQIDARPISPERLNPNSELFDPIRAALIRRRHGDLDEAGWLVFLFTHFGKNLKSGYQLIRDVYGRLGAANPWNWNAVANDVWHFRHWLGRNQAALKTDVHAHRGFGNHRKYQSLDAWKRDGTGAAVESYVLWVRNAGGHEALFNSALEAANGDGKNAFKRLYKDMRAVRSFGRTAKFDYLSMIGKTGVAAIEPDSVYFQSATGPVDGARLLFGGRTDAPIPVSQVEQYSDALADALGLGKQVIEDSLCNWQKSPTVPERFRG